MAKSTKVVATLGPASDKPEIMEQLIENGVNVFRMNFSHGSQEYHEENIRKIRATAERLGEEVGILQDCCGPKIRVGMIDGFWDLKEGDKIVFHTEIIEGYRSDDGVYHICINQPDILPEIKVGRYIYLYDGFIRAKTVKTTEAEVTAIIENHGKLSSRKGVNFPNTVLGIDVVTQKDKEDIIFGISHEVDYIAISFVQNVQDIITAKEHIKAHGGHQKVFAKIEKFDAVDKIDNILKEVDGIMVARGDLGIEVPYYVVPEIQKSIIAKCNQLGKPVITATQMLVTMVDKEIPTRAEVSDVANAVLDGTDCVMLSEESAMGNNPPLVVETMSNIIKGAEKIFQAPEINKHDLQDYTDVIAQSAVDLANRINACAIICLTNSGGAARKITKYRPNAPIYAVARSEKVLRQLCVSRGVQPLFSIEDENTASDIVSAVIKKAYSKGFIKKGGTYILTTGLPAGQSGTTNFIRIINDEELAYYLSK